LLQPSPVPAIPLSQRLRAGAGRRTLAIGLTLLIEGLLLFLLLTFGVEKQPGRKERSLTVVQLQAGEEAEESPAPASPEREEQAEEQPAPPQPETRTQPVPQPAEPREVPPLPAPVPVPVAPPPPPPVASPSAPARPAPAPRRVYGPPDTGGTSASSRDSEVVGTAPNGEPLYAAAWYREPRPSDLGAYLATARGPGWGLIACRTAPGYRVEDCVPLAEYPAGSQINRAILAAAWEFKVLPPRRGGRVLVGSWVRIRIDYTIDRR